MKQKLFAILILIVMMSLPFSAIADDGIPTTSWLDNAAAGFADGDGAEDTPFIIETPAELAYFTKTVYDAETNYEGLYIELADDVDMSAHLWTPIGRNFATGTGGITQENFKGHFNGNNKAIKNIIVNPVDTVSNQGFFGYVDGGSIKNVSLVDCNISGENAVGGLAGRVGNCEITNCSVTGVVSGTQNVGGLIGTATAISEIDSCSSIASVDGRGAVGGLIGAVGSNALISNSYSKGNVIGRGSEIGGFAGLISHNTATVSRCYATGNVSGTRYVGGFVGQHLSSQVLSTTTPISSTIQNCYATGNVSGTIDYLGGFVGKNEGSIGNCYAIGTVTYTGTADEPENIDDFVGNSLPLLDENTDEIPSISGQYNKDVTLAKLNSGSENPYFEWTTNAWRADITPAQNNVNGGYPIFGYQVPDKIKVTFSFSSLDQGYTGTPLSPGIANDRGLVKDTDYTVAFNNEPIEMGTYTVTVTLTNVDFVIDGSNTATFVISEKKNGMARVEEVTTVPTANVASGTVSKGTEIALSSQTSGARIYYTLDGTQPTIGSSVYSTPILITKDMTIRAFALANGMGSSVPVSFNYKISDKEKEADIEFEVKEDAKSIKFIKGYADKTFKPDQAITRYEILESLNNLLTFKRDDLDALTDTGLEYSDLVILFSGSGIIEGHDDSTFKGSDGLTRAEFVKIMAVILKLDLDEAMDDKFPDIGSHWSRHYVNNFVILGYIKGYDDGTFKPNNILTRAEFTTIVNRIIKNNSAPSENIYTDLSPDHWAYNEVLKAFYLE